MKRYGYKFLTPDSARNKASAIRQAVFFIGMPVWALAVILDPENLESTCMLFFAIGVTYALVTLLAEVLPKLGFFISALLPWVVIGALCWQHYFVEQEPLPAIGFAGILGLILFLGYFSAISYVSVKLLINAFKVNR